MKCIRRPGGTQARIETPVGEIKKIAAVDRFYLLERAVDGNTHGKKQIVPMDNKKRLLEECATTAAGLLGAGCEQVVVRWDEEPAWSDKEQSPGDDQHGPCQSLRREVLRRRSLP